MLELGFPPESDIRDVLDLGFNINISDLAGSTDRALEMSFNTNNITPDENPLEMGFDMDLVDESALEMGFDMDLVDESPLEMGFDMDPAHFDLDRSYPIGFVIQWAVGDLHISIHQLAMDQEGDAMSQRSNKKPVCVHRVGY
ncbi:hypothetical protein BDR03DRAFT_1017242 [Suillus americanus]|nr:hypothetical protein BDR03DRAFT_1017242 [Suillus americanus]